MVAFVYCSSLWLSSLTDSTCSPASLVDGCVWAGTFLPMVWVSCLVVEFLRAALSWNCLRHFHLSGLSLGLLLFHTLRSLGWSCCSLIVSMLPRGHGLWFAALCAWPAVSACASRRVRLFSICGGFGAWSLRMCSSPHSRNGYEAAERSSVVLVRLHTPSTGYEAAEHGLTIGVFAPPSLSTDCRRGSLASSGTFVFDI